MGRERRERSEKSEKRRVTGGREREEGGKNGLVLREK
mgnify:CR=1 FL=1